MPALQTLATAHVELFFRCAPWPEEADPSPPSMARHQWAHAAAAGVPPPGASLVGDHASRGAGKQPVSRR